MEREDHSFERAFATFTTDVATLEAHLALPAEYDGYLDLARESAFRAGWNSYRQWTTQADPAASTVRCRTVHTVHALVDVGDRAWVQPLAIVEHMVTGERFADPLFTIAAKHSARYCIELVVTDAGLVAVGPPDRHRLATDVDRGRLRPLVDFQIFTPGH